MKKPWILMIACAVIALVAVGMIGLRLSEPIQVVKTPYADGKMRRDVRDTKNQKIIFTDIYQNGEVVESWFYEEVAGRQYVSRRYFHGNELIVESLDEAGLITERAIAVKSADGSVSAYKIYRPDETGTLTYVKTHHPEQYNIYNVITEY